MSAIVDRMVLPYITQIGIKLEENHPYKSCGSTFSILPEVGEGFYWVYGYENQFTVTVSALTMKETIQPKYTHPAFFTIGSYDNTSARFVSDRVGSAGRSLLGYFRSEGIFHEVLYKGYSGKGVSFSLSAPFAEELAGRLDMNIHELTKRCFSLNGTERIPEAAAILRQVQWYTPTPRFAHLYYESKLMELLVILCQRHDLVHPQLPKSNLRKEDMENLQRVTDYLHAHYKKNPDLHTLGAIAYMGRTKLTQTFKQMYGVAITQYVRQLRVEQAKVLLKDQRLPLGEIAVLVGYQSQGSFTDLFKEATGLTPREYRHLFCDASL